MLEFHSLFSVLCTSFVLQIHVLHNKRTRVFWCCSSAKIMKGYNQYFENINVNYYFRIDSKFLKYLH